MSFLTQTLARRATVIPRAATAVSARHFTTSLAAQKTITESAKDGMKTVDRAVSDKLVDGLDAATAAKEKVQQTADKAANSQAASKAQQLKDEASGKASELQGEAKGKAKEAEGKAKGAAEEVKNKL